MAVIFPARTVSEMSSMMGGPPYPAVSPSVRSTTSGSSVMALVHPEIGVDHPGVAAQTGKRSLGDDLAEVHHHHLMAGSLDEREVVLDHDHGAALRRELADCLADPRAEHGVNASHRLVQDDQPGLGGGEPDAAGVRSPEPGHEVDDGALARAVRPDKSGHLTLGNREGAVPHRVDAAEGLGQVLDLEQRGAHPAPPSSAACPSGAPSRAAPAAAGGEGTLATATTGPGDRWPAGTGSRSSPGRSRKSPSGRNRSIRMIMRPMRIWRIAGPKSGRDAGDGRYRVSSMNPI